MRLAVSLVALVLASPVWADDIPERTQLGLRALLTASVAAKTCDEMELDPERFDEVAKSYGIEDADILEKFGDFSVGYTADLLKAQQDVPKKFCALALGAFGPGGTIPDLLGTDR